MLTALLTQTCTVVNLTDGTVDVNRNFVRTPSSVTEPCLIQQLGTSEPGDGGVGVVARWRWFGVADSTVTAASRVVVDGVPYRVDGQPHRVWGRYTVSHVEAMLSLAVDVEDAV